MTNSSVNIHSTGATGYIGGDSLYLISQTHPEWELTLLVRDEAKATKMRNQYSQARIVIGDLENSELLMEESRKADIVYHFAHCDHEPSAHAIACGLAQHSPDSPGWWIHTSGTGTICYPTFRAKDFGLKREEVFNDWDDIGTLTNAPDDAPHWPTEKIVLKAGTEHGGRVKTAIVCPPCIFGPGRGPVNTRSIQAYELAREILIAKEGVQLGPATNIWTEVHVQDLSMVYLLLGEAAAQGGGSATWGKEGFYFAENGEFDFQALSKAVTEAAYDKGLISSPKIRIMSVEESERSGIMQRWGGMLYLIGTNARCRAIRARKLLGWAPKQRKLLAEAPCIVEAEAKALGVVPGGRVAQ
ncbi:hypothetical protein PV08_05143 [Exophiala spinifera]|uniref:Uncharacterized protein n=1 Tax=Exophiala spinifera TaxID=91928 RepID=A0A0D2BG43_9EURO|nr:uncharacterized protein PV08_05143 [Exophiala spinifera]KIW17948.1 hypothetical protein PV08_05143 [Exophiala spinifera]